MDPIRYLLAKTVKAKDTDGTTLVVASTPEVDRVGDVVAPDWQLAAFRDNPVILWSHQYDEPPVGRATKIDLDGDKLMARIAWDDHEANPRGRLIAHQYREGVLNAVSVGFAPGKRTERASLPDDDPRKGGQGYVLEQNELMEISAVPVPAHRGALAVRRMGGCPHCGGHKDEHGGVTPFADLPIVDVAWNADSQPDSEIIGAILGSEDSPNWKRFQQAHLWWDSSMPEEQASYKLKVARMYDADDPENAAPSGGRLTVIFRQLASRVAILRGARGGVDLPEEDKQAALAHARRYYEKLGRDFPEEEGGGGLVEFRRQLLVALRDPQVGRAVAGLALSAPTPVGGGLEGLLGLPGGPRR